MEQCKAKLHVIVIMHDLFLELPEQLDERRAGTVSGGHTPVVALPRNYLVVVLTPAIPIQAMHSQSIEILYADAGILMCRSAHPCLAALGVPMAVSSRKQVKSPFPLLTPSYLGAVYISPCFMMNYYSWPELHEVLLQTQRLIILAHSSWQLYFPLSPVLPVE